MSPKPRYVYRTIRHQDEASITAELNRMDAEGYDLVSTNTVLEEHSVCSLRTSMTFVRRDG